MAIQYKFSESSEFNQIHSKDRVKCAESFGKSFISKFKLQGRQNEFRYEQSIFWQRRNDVPVRYLFIRQAVFIRSTSWKCAANVPDWMAESLPLEVIRSDHSALQLHEMALIFAVQWSNTMKPMFADVQSSKVHTLIT